MFPMKNLARKGLIVPLKTQTWASCKYHNSRNFVTFNLLRAELF